MSRKISAKLQSAVSAKMIAVAAPVTIEAGDFNEGDKDSPPTFSSIAYSGGIVPRSTLSKTLDADYIINLAGMQKARSVKANLDHKTEQRVGHVPEVENNGKELQVSGVLSAATPYRDQVAQSVKGGYDWEVSIEAALGKPRKLAAGKKEVVNGREVSGPLYIFDKSTLTGLAFVSNGADQGNHVTIAASAEGAKKTMNEFEEFCAKLGVDLDAATEDQKANLKDLFAKQSGSGVDAVAGRSKKSISQLAEEVRANEARIDQINKIALTAMKEHPMYIDQIQNIAELAADNGTDPDMFELELIRATRTKRGTFSSHMTANTYADSRVVEAAICMMSGLENIEKHYSDETLDAVDRSGMRNNFSIQQLLLQVAQQNGYSCRAGERITTSNIRSVLQYCFPDVHARMSGFSTISLPGILGNVANKMILEGYMEEDTTWQEIAAVKNVSNFYQHSHYRMLDNLEYEEVGPSGEIKHGTLGEETYTSRARTYGKMLGLTREQIINDDLGAFNDIRERLGRGAAQKFNNVFWARFMASLGTLFPTNKTLGNYIDGAGTALGIDGEGLQAGITAYRKMKSPAADGQKRVGTSTSPTLLLVPPELEFIARSLYQSTHVNTGGAATATSVPNANIHAGRYRPVVQNRLSDTGFTGNSATQWFLFGSQLKPMVVTFLNGNRTPIVESSDADFNTLGIQFRGYHDFGCDPAEKLSGVMSKGAA